MIGHHGWMSPDDARGDLAREACRSRLLGGHRGRIGLSLRSLPTILPVTYTMAGDGVIVTTMTTGPAPGTVYGNVITFQADELDARTDERWSVSVTGIARPLPPDTDDPDPVAMPDGRSTVFPLSAFISTDLMHGVLLGRSGPE